MRAVLISEKHHFHTTGAPKASLIKQFTDVLLRTEDEHHVVSECVPQNPLEYMSNSEAFGYSGKHEIWGDWHASTEAAPQPQGHGRVKTWRQRSNREND